MLSTLQCICKTCSGILLPEEEFRTYLKRMRCALHIAESMCQGCPEQHCAIWSCIGAWQCALPMATGEEVASCMCQRSLGSRIGSASLP